MTVHLHVEVIGAIVAVAVVASITSSIYWMLHPPTTLAERVASKAQLELEQMVGSVIVVFSPEIHSEHMMVLAARLARRQKAELLAAYIVEVPFTLPTTADMDTEDRTGLDTLAAAETIALKNGVHIRTKTIHARQISQAVLDLAKSEGANLLVLGSYREGKYAGAPLGRAIEAITANAKCDVLIGVQGRHGKLLNAEGNLV